MRAAGLSRYMAVCLLLGYAWLAIAGLAWMATAAGLPLRDTALHRRRRHHLAHATTAGLTP
jgi:hypothetical protein